MPTASNYSGYIEHCTGSSSYDYVMGEDPMSHPAGKFYSDAINT